MSDGRGVADESPPDVVAIDPDAIAAESDALGVGAGDAPPGTYAVVYSLDADAEIAVGALGTARFPAGAYAYVGSAFGSNGLGRVDRHRRVAGGAHDVRHWHVDYLGGHPEASLAAVVAAPRADVECRLAAGLIRRATDPGRSAGGRVTASALAPAPLDGFGASDCDCRAHLVAADGVETIRSAAVEALRSAVAESSGESNGESRSNGKLPPERRSVDGS